MKRKATVFFLTVFAASQIYFSRHPTVHQVASSSWLEVTHSLGTLVSRQGRYYVVSPHHLLRLQVNSVHIGTASEPVTWEEVPQPGGRGVWRVAYTAHGLALVGYGGPVHPSPDGRRVVWQDPASGKLYQSDGLGTSLSPLVPGLRQVRRILWAPDGDAVAMVGIGPSGHGIYVADGDHNVMPGVIAPSVVAFGFTHQETVLAALQPGNIVWQGHPAPQISHLKPVFVDNGKAVVWGVHGDRTVFWKHPTLYERPEPALTFTGNAEFSPSGGEVAILAAEPGRQADLYLDGTVHQWSVRLPFGLATKDYRLLGFVGNHWVLISVLNGSHAGTYSWWIGHV